MVSARMFYRGCPNTELKFCWELGQKLSHTKTGSTPAARRGGVVAREPDISIRGRGQFRTVVSRIDRNSTMTCILNSEINDN